MLIGIFRKEICTYRRKNESYLKETIVCSLSLLEKSPDLFLILRKNSPDKLLIFYKKPLISKFWIWQP